VIRWRCPRVRDFVGIGQGFDGRGKFALGPQGAARVTEIDDDRHVDAHADGKGTWSLVTTAQTACGGQGVLKGLIMSVCQGSFGRLAECKRVDEKTPRRI